MHLIFKKIFYCLSPQYYFRQFVFGMIIPIIYFLTAPSIPFMTVLFLMISTFLYPYSRFVYERVVSFIMGNNVFFVNAFFMLFVKIITMAVCFVCAIFIAPIGLTYLYCRQQKEVEKPTNTGEFN